MKRSISKSIKFSLLYLFFIFIIFTQFTYGASENESWTKISFEKKINSNLKVELAQGLRLNEHITNLKLAFFEGSILYKLSNGIKIGIPYRYTILGGYEGSGRERSHDERLIVPGGKPLVSLTILTHRGPTRP